MEMPSQGRAIIDENFDGIKIIIATKKSWFMILFLGFGLGGWFMGETFAFIEVVGGKQNGSPDAFLIFWLGGWTIGGFFVSEHFFGLEWERNYFNWSGCAYS